MIEEGHRIACPIYLWLRGETNIFCTQKSIPGGYNAATNTWDTAQSQQGS